MLILERANVSQRQLARLVGTSESNISAYRSGAKQVGSLMAERVALAVRIGPEHDIVRYEMSTLASTARLIRQLLKEGDTGTAFRMVLQALTDFRRYKTEEERALWLARPTTTGSQRWDALLASLAAFAATEAGMETPSWVSLARFRLATWWFVSDLEGMWPYIFANTPPQFRVRGVMVDRASLDSV